MIHSRVLIKIKMGVKMRWLIEKMSTLVIAKWLMLHHCSYMTVYVHAHSCLVWQIRNITLIRNKYEAVLPRRNTLTWDIVPSFLAVWKKEELCGLVMASQEEKVKKAKKQLIDILGRLYDACVNGVLDYGVVVVDASLHIILVFFVSINFELARIIKASLVYFRSDDLNWNVCGPAINLESIFISAWPVCD